jgi:hypothetical protein
MHRARVSVIVSCAFALGCSPRGEAPGEDRCLAIVRDYQTAMVDAIVCDPAESGSCGAGRPLIVSRQGPDGQVTLEGLCMPPCYGAVNPARTATLDELLTQFEAQGCQLGPCPCPPPEWMPPACLESGECWGIGPAP